MSRSVRLPRLPDLALAPALLLLCACSSSTAEVQIESSADLQGREGRDPKDVPPEADSGWSGSQPTGDADPAAPSGPASEPGADPASPAHLLPIATLPGFRMYRDGRSRVFVEVSGSERAVSVVESVAEGRLSYRLAGVQVPERVNRLALPTDSFRTPVARVTLIQAGSDADLVIELRLPAKPEARLKSTARGQVLSVDFPVVSDRDLPAAVASPGVPGPGDGSQGRPQETRTIEP